MSKCDNCLEWEYFGDGTVGCFCMRRTEKLKDDEDCVLFAAKNKNLELAEIIRQMEKLADKGEDICIEANQIKQMLALLKELAIYRLKEIHND